MAIFGTKKQLNIFRCSKTLIFDGSFKYRPQDTYQIYRGFGFINETHCLPLVTVLMRGKHRNLYEKMWRKIAEAAEPLGKMRTKSANFDCEPAAYKSFKVQFKNVEVKKCSFHVKQALNKKVQAIGLMLAYQKEAEVQKIVRQIGALQLTPPSEWDKCLELIKGFVVCSSLTPTQQEKLLEVLEYYNSTWIKLGASFISLWGIDGPRTTNSAESYHGRQQYHFRKKARLGEWIIRNRELHYREKNGSQHILEGQVYPNKPQQKYAEVTAKLFQRQRDLADFLLEPSTEEEYNNTIILKFERVSLKDVVSEESTDKQELEVIELPAKKMQSAYDVEPTQFLEIEADGNCLYRSISHFVKGSRYYHREVRKELMAYLLESLQTKWSRIFGTPEEIVDYANKHQKPEEWGHSKELILAARLYQYNFILFKPFEKPKFVFFSTEYEQLIRFNFENLLKWLF